MTTTKKSLSIILFLLFTHFLNNKTAEPTTCITVFDAIFWEGSKQVTKKAIYRKDIFHCITGMQEPDFIEQLKKTCTMPTMPEKTIKLAQSMSHSHPTLQELKNNVQNKLSS